MSAELFLTCFLACLFAFVVLVVLALQIVGFFIRRWITKNLPEILSSALHSGTGVTHPADEAMLREILKNSQGKPDGVVPHLSVVTCGCGFHQTVPLALPLPPFLTELGWQYDERFEGWGCPTCVKQGA